jgi:hypothetical protein
MPKFIVESVSENMITVRVPGMNYQNTFQFKGTLAHPLIAGDRIRATIHAPAWKVDRVAMGGNYVEPLYGRPRRMQGTILSVNAAANELTVHVAYDVTVKLPAKYAAGDFLVGERIGWDNIEIPLLEVQSIAAAAATPAH